MPPPTCRDMQTESLTLDIKLAAFEPPKVTEPRDGKWVKIGKDNLFFENLIKRKNNSVTQKSISKTIADLIAGDGFAYDESNTALKDFLTKINLKGEGESGNSVLKKVGRDMANCAGRAYQVIWNEDGSFIAEVYHQKWTTIRPGVMNENEDVTHYWLCRDWSNTAKYKPVEIPVFNPKTAKEDKRQLFVRFEESEEIEYFPLPAYASAEPYMELEEILVRHSLASVKNKQRLGRIVWIKKNLDDQPEKRIAFKESFKKSFNGPEADDTMFVFDDAPEMGVEVVALPIQENASTETAAYEAIATQKICTANRLTSPVIAGLSGGQQLGGNSNEISIAFEYFMNTVVRPVQKEILEDFMLFLKYRKGAIKDNTLLGRVKQLFTLNKKQEKNKPVLSISNTMPIQFTFSENLLENILTDNELREAIGYDPIDNPEADKTDANASKTDSASGAAK